MVRADPLNSLSVLPFINAHHDIGIACPPPLYYHVQPSMPFHNFGGAVLLDGEPL